jgi:hypothetical protein
MLHINSLLGALFAGLRKATISFVISVRPNEQLGSNWTDIDET